MVRAWTARSPSGQPIPIRWVQEALDRLERDGEIEISVSSIGYRSAFIGAVLRELPGAEVVTSVSPPRIRLLPSARAIASGRPARVILLGCVKTKLDRRAAAKDLYCSRLWAGRRAYAESLGESWLILSAMHGLVEPEVELDPYDLALADLSPSERKRWGEQVVRRLEMRFGDLSGMTFEVHAGAAYRRAIEPGIRERGGQVLAPLGNIPLGSQPSWYQSRLVTVGEPSAPRRQRSTTGQFRAAIRALDTAPKRIPARGWPDGLDKLDRPGLYSWWVDQEGAADLSEGLGHLVEPGRIYAGQTGATKWPSGKAGAATLASRIGGNHLRGGIRGSTFRLTLASCLVRPLALVRIGQRRLDSPSERRLSGWMHDHLEIAVLPLADGDVLGHLEHRVLLTLDPPLNLDGMSMNPLRSELSRRRASLA